MLLSVNKMSIYLENPIESIEKLLQLTVKFSKVIRQKLYIKFNIFSLDHK